MEIKPANELECIELAKAIYARSRFGWLVRKLKLLKTTDGYDRLATRLSESYRSSKRFPKSFPSNSLEGLWYSQSRYLDRLDADQGLEVLQAWIRVLYVPESEAIDLEQRRSEIMRQRIAANMPWHQGKPGAVHLHFVEPMSSLVQNLSDELGPYS